MTWMIPPGPLPWKSVGVHGAPASAFVTEIVLYSAGVVAGVLIAGLIELSVWIAFASRLKPVIARWAAPPEAGGPPGADQASARRAARAGN